MDVVPSAIPEWHEVDAELFRTRIRPQARPAVLRGLVRQWPATLAAARSPADLAAYLVSRYNGLPVPLFEGPPEIGGRFFYDAGLQGFNFQASRAPLDQVIERILATGSDPKPPTLYSGSLSIPLFLPGFASDNHLPGMIAAPSSLESIWIGNRTRIAPHFDASENIACVVAGRRQFILFPPEQIANLYVGPIDRTPAGQPISLVDPREPDLERFPRFAQALANAQMAELGPGDAVYIPMLWWHGVEALEPFNVLVNYWWQENPAHFEPPMNSLLHCLLSIKSLPPDQRGSWKALFDYLIFQTDGPALEHIPAHARGILGELTPDAAARIRAILVKELTRRGR